MIVHSSLFGTLLPSSEESVSWPKALVITLFALTVIALLSFIIGRPPQRRNDQHPRAEQYLPAQQPERNSNQLSFDDLSLMFQKRNQFVLSLRHESSLEDASETRINGRVGDALNLDIGLDDILRPIFPYTGESEFQAINRRFLLVANPNSIPQDKRSTLLPLLNNGIRQFIESTSVFSTSSAFVLITERVENDGAYEFSRYYGLGKRGDHSISSQNVKAIIPKSNTSLDGEARTDDYARRIIASIRELLS